MNRLFFTCVLVLVGSLSVPGTSPPFTHGMIASVHPLATEAGLKVLKQGGNAIDAAAAVAFTLGVVDGENSGLGGGCLMLIRLAKGDLVALDGRETAPGAATRDMYLRGSVPQTELSQTGALASGVPGALAAYEFAVSHYGRKKLKQLLLPAAELAEKGFVVDSAYSQYVKSVMSDLARFEPSRAIFLKDGKAPLPGELFRQPELARSYRQVAEQGSAWFYRGPFARLTAKWMKENGGILTEEDFRKYQVKLREPILSTYRGYKLAGFPPPSSGGIHVAEIMNILENFDLKSTDPAARLHLIAEAMKFAFADRAYWLGDSDFIQVPPGLAEKAYGKSLAQKVDRDHIVTVASHGEPPVLPAHPTGKHTTHFSVVDSEGNWVACTATINTTFGSKVVIPGTGIIMNNEMDDFSIQPGVTNFFGLVGAEANAIAPGKRPLSSMSPTLVFDGDQPIIALGAAGGPKIITQVVLELVGMLDFGMSPSEALAQPRIHHQWVPDRLMVEPSLPQSIQDRLRIRGHTLEVVPAMGVSQIVARAAEGEGFIGAADRRANGCAGGW